MISYQRSTGTWLVINQGRAAVVAVLDDLQVVARLFGQERLGTPIDEDQQVHLGDLAQQPAVAAIATREAQRRKQARDLVVQPRGRPGRPCARSAGQPALAHAAGAGDHEVAPGPEAPVQFAMLTAGQEKPRRPPRRWTPPDWCQRAPKSPQLWAFKIPWPAGSVRIGDQPAV